MSAPSTGDSRESGLAVLCRLDDLRDGAAASVRRPGGAEAVVVRWGSEVFVMPPRCPHRGAPLAHGIVRQPRLSDEPGDMGEPDKRPALVCPWHSWRFYLDTGEEVSTGDCTLRVERAQVVDGDVCVRSRKGREPRSP